MKNLKPTIIRRTKPFLLFCEWQDGFSGTIKLETLRNECPCALCKGEEIAGKQVAKPIFQMITPGKNELKSLEPVGNYAIQASWGDGHNTGIYTWEYLREIFENFSLSSKQLEELMDK